MAEMSGDRVDDFLIAIITENCSSFRTAPIEVLKARAA
jgi:hypothetical protein